MSNETKFIPGLIVKAPNDKAPEYVKAKLSIKRQELLEWLQSQSGEWINAEVKVSKNSGKWYCAVDSWKPKEAREERPQRQSQKAAPDPDDDFDSDRIPF